MNKNGGEDIVRVYNYIIELTNIKPKDIEIKKLPEFYYESLLDLEIEISNDFSNENFEKLIQLYLTGIKIYMEKNDTEKAQGLGIRVINFLSNSEVIKKLKERKKEEKNKSLFSSEKLNKEEDKFENLKIEFSQKNSPKKKIGGINLIQKIEKQNTFNISHEKNKVQRKLNDYYKNSKNIKLIVEQELNKQKQSFELRRRNKFENKKINLEKENCTVLTTETTELDESQNFEMMDLNNNESNKKIIEDIYKFKVNLPLKYKKNLLNLKNQIDNYIVNYANNIYDNYFMKSSEKIKSILEEKHLKYVEIHKEYCTKMKNIKFLLSIDEDTNDEEINEILDTMKKEENEIINKMNVDYDKLLTYEISNYKKDNLKNFSPILEEKIKRDIYSELNKMF
jgi:hypothetical protein